MNDYYQVFRHVPQNDGSVLDVPTPDIFVDKDKAEALAKRDITGVFEFCNIKKSVKKISEAEFRDFLIRNFVMDDDEKIKLFPESIQ